MTISPSEGTVENLKRGIDIHVHFREPGFEQKETLTTGAISAYIGGISTVIEMPNTFPPVDTLPYFNQKTTLIEKTTGQLRNLGIDFKIHQAAALTNYNTENIEGLRALVSKAKLFKVFLANSTGNLGIDHLNLQNAISEIIDEMKAKPLIIFHAEDPELISSTHSWRDHHKMRPVEAEINAIEYVLTLSQEYSLPMHVTHVSTAKGAELLAEQKRVTWDVLPKHLEFSVDDLSKFENLGIMNPPLRPEAERETLYFLFTEEKIPMLSSDHAPHTLKEKMNPISGAPGVQELMPFAIDKWLSGEISREYLNKITFENPKRVLKQIGLGVVEESLQVVTDLTTKVDQSWIKSKCGWSLWKGMVFRGRIFNSYPVALENLIQNEISQYTD